MRGERGRADQAHQEHRGVEDRHFEDERQPRSAGRARQSWRKRAPVRPPEAAEEVIAAEFPVEDARRATSTPNMTVEENVVAMPAPTSSRRGKPSLPKIRHQAASALTTKPMTPAQSPQHRPLHRGDEGAQHDVAEERQERPLERAHVAAGARRQRRLLPEREQDRLGEPEDRPRPGCEMAIGAPQALPHGAPHVAHRMGRAPTSRAIIGATARDERRCRRCTKAKIEVGAERAGGERVRPEPAHHHHVGRGQRRSAADWSG